MISHPSYVCYIFHVCCLYTFLIYIYLENMEINCHCYILLSPPASSSVALASEAKALMQLKRVLSCQPQGLLVETILYCEQTLDDSFPRQVIMIWSKVFPVAC